MIPPKHPQEEQRLAALRRYRILDTDYEQAFDDLTYLASYICQTPIATITLIDEKRQWFKSHFGVQSRESAREIAFCAFAILENEPFVVEDAALDPRFSDSIVVTRDPKIRFYAGAQILSDDGYPLGTLCVIDKKPRQLSDDQERALVALTRQVQAQLELRRNVLELRLQLKAQVALGSL
jgi:GAF domain-containing protein